MIPDTKATGNDGIPVRFLESNLPVISSLLMYIINLSIASKTVPNKWKSATVTPLYKENDRNDLANYRPISILPAVSKILGRVVHRQVYSYLSSNKLLSDAQFGFRKGYSTSTCVLKLINTIFHNMEMGNLTGVLFLDLKKAFDTVNHEILLHKLCKYGMSPNVVDWFRNYLTGHIQNTKVNNTLSDNAIVQCGVPQGSILGPLLFILYINDLLGEVINDCSISLYADDTALYYSNSSYVDLKVAIRDDIGSVSEWLRCNKLILNTKKTKFMIFGSKNKLREVHDAPIYINGDLIERVDCFEYLGVYLDETLSFDQHINYIYNKACSKLGAIHKLRLNVDQSTAMRL